MAGKVDWAGFINKIYEAFDKKVNDMVYAAVMAAGDKVLIEHGSGIEVKDGDDKVMIVREAEILAVLS